MTLCVADVDCRDRPVRMRSKNVGAEASVVPKSSPGTVRVDL